jgi:hypothetical protein
LERPDYRIEWSPRSSQQPADWPNWVLPRSRQKEQQTAGLERITGSSGAGPKSTGRNTIIIPNCGHLREQVVKLREGPGAALLALGANVWILMIRTLSPGLQVLVQ